MMTERFFKVPVVYRPGALHSVIQYLTVQK